MKEKKLSYFREVQNELKRVSWTSKEELLFCTKTVIISVFIFGFTIYSVDLIIRALLNGAGFLVRSLFG